LAEIIKSVGFQHKQANDLKKPLLKLQMNLEERFLAPKRNPDDSWHQSENWFIDFGRGFQKVEVS